MSDPRSAILQAARELFLGQGFSQTTIQQLADAVGISKGAVYLHFRSKSDVMLALIREIEEGVIEAVRAIAERTDLTAKERLRQQLRYQFADMREQCVLFEVFFKDSTVALNEELTLLAQKARVDWQNLSESFVCDAFPDHDPRFTTDIAIALNGALNEYYTFVLLEGADVDPDSVAHLLVEVAEAIAERLESSRLDPVLDKTALPDHADIEAKIQQAKDDRIESALTEIETLASEAATEAASEITETLDAIRHALGQSPRSRVILQGLIANLREFKQIAAQRKALAYELGLKLV